MGHRLCHLVDCNAVYIQGVSVEVDVGVRAVRVGDRVVVGQSAVFERNLVLALDDDALGGGRF